MVAPDTSFILQDAIDLHRRGAIADACARYAEILRREPRNPDALYLSGLAHCHLGELDEAIKRLRKAVAVVPKHAAAHNTLSMALRQQGRIDAALASADRAIACDTNFAEAHANRGDILQDLRRPLEALDAYDRALALKPDLVTAWINRGALLEDLGRPDEAVTSYDRAILLAPEAAVAWLNRAKALRGLGRQDDALASCDRALMLQPDFAAAHLARGILLSDRGDYESSVTCYDRAIALQPVYPEAYLERASALQKAGDLDSAIESCDRAIALDPSGLSAWELRSRVLNDAGSLDDALASIDRALALMPDVPANQAFRAAILLKQNRPADALAALERAIALDPRRATSHLDRGLALQALGRFEEASIAFAQASSLKGDDPHLQFNIGLFDLLHGRWIEGFAKYERRLELPRFNLLHSRFCASGGDIERRFTQPLAAHACAVLRRWPGTPPGDQPILLETEQGIGDSIQFAGFAAHLVRLGYRIEMLTLPLLAPLMRTIAGIENVFDDGSALTDSARRLWLPLMSSPHVLGTTPDTVPFEVPYLSVDPARAMRWRERLGEAGFKVGIAWQGNPQNWLDAGRSIPLAAFAPIAELSGVRLISLQKCPGAEQIDQTNFGTRIERVMDENDKSAEALLDTTAIIMNLDLVVTSDSMVAHLAGALARRTFIALRRVPDWRWMLDRDDTPWYPTARLFRQESEGDWGPVLRRIADAIRNLVSEP